MKKICTAFCLVVVLILGLAPCYADSAGITLEVLVDYDNERLTVSGVTPAAYGQKISVVVYQPETPVEKLADVTNQENPEAELPLNKLSQIGRMDDVFAAYNGSYNLTIPLKEAEPGFYVVSVSGNGALSGVSKASAMIYFETQKYINETTLPAINRASETEIDSLIRQKELLFGVKTDADYEENKEMICSLFASIRDADYQGAYTRMSQVQDTFSAINVIRQLLAAADGAALKEICLKNAALFGLDLTDSDYVGHEDEIYGLMLGITKETTPSSMKSVAKAFRQSIGLAAVNRTKASGMTACITKYAADLDFSVSDYQKACSDYGAGEINKAFIEQNFTLPKEVSAALAKRLENPPDKGGASSGPSSGRGGGNVSVGNSLLQTAPPDEALKQAKFRDVSENHWSFTAVQSLAEMGVLSGVESGMFAPDEKVSREQFIKMMIAALKLQETGAKAEFTDVASERWSAAYIAAAAQKGIVTGYEDGSFAPAEDITRQDAAVILRRACTVKKITLEQGEIHLTDAEAISGYARESVSALSGSGIITGFEDGSFRPFGTLTRAQAAKMIYELVLR